MSRMYPLISLCIATALIVNVKPSQSQNQRGTVAVQVDQGQVPAPSAMSSQVFEIWMTTEADKVDVERQKGLSRAELLRRLQVLEQPVVSRLQSEKFTTDEAILRMQNAWFNYEASGGVTGPSFSETKRFTASMVALLNKRPSLEARLHQVLAQVFTSEENLAEAAKEHDRALQLLNPLHIDVDVQRISTTVELATILYSLGEKKRAEALYLEALSYDWFKVQNSPSAFQRLRELYLQAGRGLIEARRDNLNALKEITFWPSTMENLGPVLRQAIEQAQANQAGG